MKIAIIKYNAGNVLSVTNALRRLGIDPVVTDDPAELDRADKVIFPGVGEASTAMNYLIQRKLDQVILGLRQPFLGICLGLQVMCRRSEENDTPCLGIFDLEVKKFPPLDKVPHMGWNRIEVSGNPLFKGMEGDIFLYYVHSYYAEPGADTIATTNYIVPFSAALQRDNYYAVQAHPEKSGHDGALILKNFLNI
ncbi:MAG TPA: imidazole glycerol phosphate synthase subunit HisH [Cyclobacteriaceae bacterium]|nr:imidazole glycerol phosphate synthase subunit HisH [Cyclobacteriaceae bacterium]